MAVFAVKRLTRSDLTFFESQFRKLNAGNQKSINLNADVFIKRLYPTLPQISTQVAVALEILGPAGAGPHQVSRKIVRNTAYKNWRLNGEFVRDPAGEPGRYDGLAEGDVAVLAFEGIGKPTSVDLHLLAATSADDASLVAAFQGLLGQAGMVEATADQLAETIRTASPSDTHPIHGLLVEPAVVAEVEDAIVGSPRAVRALRKRQVRVSPSKLLEARENASRIGALGEELVAGWLESEHSEGRITAWRWASQENAVSPHDFEVTYPDGSAFRVEVKSTTGPFERPFHISAAEVTAAVESGVPSYRLFRVYGLSEEAAWLAWTDDVKFVCEPLGHLGLPNGVECTGFTIEPRCIPGWAEPIRMSPNGGGS